MPKFESQVATNTPAFKKTATFRAASCCPATG